MLQPRGRLDLGQKTIGAERGGEVGMQDLHRDVAIVADVAGEIDARHPSAAYLAIDAIAIGDGLREAGSRVGHCDCGGRLRRRGRVREYVVTSDARPDVSAIRECLGWGARGGGLGVGARGGLGRGTVLRGPLAVLPILPAILQRLRSGQPHPLAHSNRRTTDCVTRRRACVARSARAQTAAAARPRSSYTQTRARARRQRRDGPGSGARAVAVLPAPSAILRAVARKTSGGSVACQLGRVSARANERALAPRR